jgi:hypothetical protein
MKMKIDYSKLAKMFTKNLSRRFGTKTKFVLSYDDEFGYYLVVSYKPNSKLGMFDDDKVATALEKSTLGKYFDQSGAGTDFSTRDVTFFERKKARST